MTVKAMGQIALLDMNDVVASSTAPINPPDGALWWNTTESQLYVYHGSTWILSTTGLDIGGTNLIQSSFLEGVGTNPSTKSFTSSAWASELISKTNLTSILQSGETYTISYDIQLTARTSVPTVYALEQGLYLYSASTSNDVTFYVTNLVNVGDKAHIVKTFVCPPLTDQNMLIYTNRYSTSGNSPYGYDTMMISNLKLEKGSIATGYSPAPEDQASAVTVTSIQTTLGNMANDSLIDYNERQYTKDKITDIIGYIQPDATSTLPTTATLDTGSKGSFYKSRKSALDAGLTTSDTNYVNLATQYNALKTYLEGLTPIDCWDVSTTNQNTNITVTKSTWRTNWSNYYNAEQQLDTATSAKLKSNVDSLQVGGTNLINNSAFTSADSSTGIETDWQPFNPTDAWTIDNTNTFNGYNTLMYQWVTGDTQTYPIVSSNDIDVVALGLIGKQVTLSVWAKIPSGVTLKTVPYIEIATYSDSSTSAQGTSNPAIQQVMLPQVGDGIWHKYILTVVVPSTNTYGKVLTIRANLRTNNTGTGYTTADQLWYALPKLELGQVATDWSPNPNDVIPQINTVVNSAMLNIDTDSITSTVVGSSALDTRLAPYVDSTWLSSNYSTTSDMQSADSDILTKAQNYADQYKIDTTKFVATTDTIQSVNDITNYITKSGGVNLVKNSVGFAGVNVPIWNWYSTDHTITNTTTDGLDSMGFGSGFMFTANANNKGIYQDIPVTAGQPYTMSWYLNKMTGVSGDATYRFYVQIQEDANNDGTIETVYDLPDNSATITNGYQYYTTTYTPVTDTIRVRFIAYANCTAIVTGIMLNTGSLALQWQLSAGEIYNTIVKMDLNGITVAHLDSTGVETSRTIMTPDKFAGYYDVNQDGVIDESDDSIDEVFRIDATNFIMQNAVVKSSITMDTVKIIPVNATGHIGWAWVASAD